MEDKVLDGERLCELFMNKQDTLEVAEMKGKASKFLDAACEEIEKNINAGKEPISIVSTIESKAGIIAPNKQLESLFTSFLFTTIMKKEAKKRKLMVDFQPSVKQVSADSQPIMELILVCTFDI